MRLLGGEIVCQWIAIQEMKKKSLTVISLSFIGTTYYPVQFLDSKEKLFLKSI